MPIPDVSKSLTRSVLAARFAMLAAKREVEEASADRVATDLGQSEVGKSRLRQANPI
jgi:hypothetical protein